MGASNFVPINQEPLSTNNSAVDSVAKAKNEQLVAEATLKKRLAEDGLQGVEQLKEREQKLRQERADFEKQKSIWLASFEAQKAEETDKIKKVKAYWEAKATPVKEAENELLARANALTERETSIKTREQSLETRIDNLDNAIKLKEQQIQELGDIISDKAPHYYKMFKKMVAESERRADWNKNMARSDQWHNFNERIGIIFDSLKRMLIGE